MNKMKKKIRGIKSGSLYLVVSEEYGNGRSAIEIVEAAIAGGVDILQLREKKKSGQELIELGTKIAKLCRDSGVIFIVNDDPMLAKRVDADGVHLGQEDMGRFSVEMARDAIGPDRIIGVSTHSLEEFKKSSADDVDYLAFGPIFQTKTKTYCIGTKEIKEIVEFSARPVFFIGGIDLSNIDNVLDEGTCNIALIRGITEAANISVRTKEFKEKLNKHNKAKRRA